MEKRAMFNFNALPEDTFIVRQENEFLTNVLNVSDMYLYIVLNMLFLFVVYHIAFSYVTKNILRILFLLEIIILLSSFIFLVIGMHYGDIYGQIVVLHLLTIAAVEAAVGLALIYSYYRLWRTVKIGSLSKIKG
ncbi:MAG: NADH-quinone oxidoreductase subunit K [Methanobacterium sp.]